MSKKKKVMANDVNQAVNQENNNVQNGNAQETECNNAEVVAKVGMFEKAKNFVKNNGKKLALGAGVATAAAAGFILKSIMSNNNQEESYIVDCDGNCLDCTEHKCYELETETETDIDVNQE